MFSILSMHNSSTRPGRAFPIQAGVELRADKSTDLECRTSDSLAVMTTPKFGSGPHLMGPIQKNDRHMVCRVLTFRRKSCIRALELHLRCCPAAADAA